LPTFGPIVSGLLLLVVAASATGVAAQDSPVRVSVDQLQLVLTGLKGQSDRDVAGQIGALGLTERLSAVRLQRLNADLPGDKSRQALLAVADASAFLDLPAGDVLQTPQPDAATQGRILSQATDFVVATVTKMPDFLASRATTRFTDVELTRLSGTPAMAVPGDAVTVTTTITFGNGFHFNFVDRHTTGVVYRDGKEVTGTGEGKKARAIAPGDSGLSSWGVFGPLLGLVMSDVLKGKIGWGHWEAGPTGALAVFRYAVAAEKSGYSVNYCCFEESDPAKRTYSAIAGYHGEIAVDPESGAVMRLVVKTELAPTLAIVRADVAVEYIPVEIGGKSFICPVKSIAISKAIDRLPASMVWNDSKTGIPAYLPRVTAINDAVFENYHQFRSEVRLLPGADAATTEPAK